MDFLVVYNETLLGTGSAMPIANALTHVAGSFGYRESRICLLRKEVEEEQRLKAGIISITIYMLDLNFANAVMDTISTMYLGALILNRWNAGHAISFRKKGLQCTGRLRLYIENRVGPPASSVNIRLL